MSIISNLFLPERLLTWTGAHAGLIRATRKHLNRLPGEYPLALDEGMYETFAAGQDGATAVGAGVAVGAVDFEVAVLRNTETRIDRIEGHVLARLARLTARGESCAYALVAGLTAHAAQLRAHAQKEFRTPNRMAPAMFWLMMCVLTGLEFAFNYTAALLAGYTTIETVLLAVGVSASLIVGAHCVGEAWKQARSRGFMDASTRLAVGGLVLWAVVTGTAHLRAEHARVAAALEAAAGGGLPAGATPDQHVLEGALFLLSLAVAAAAVIVAHAGHDADHELERIVHGCSRSARTWRSRHRAWDRLVGRYDAARAEATADINSERNKALQVIAEYRDALKPHLTTTGRPASLNQLVTHARFRPRPLTTAFDVVRAAVALHPRILEAWAKLASEQTPSCLGHDGAPDRKAGLASGGALNAATRPHLLPTDRNLPTEATDHA